MTDLLVPRSDSRRHWQDLYVALGGGRHARAAAVLRAAEIVTPASQATENAWAAVAGSVMDALHYASVSFTILNSHGAHGLNWRVMASNDAAFAVTVEVQASALVAASASDDYAVAQAPYRYYRIDVQTAVAGDHADAVVVGLAKG